ncbi:hypothetical protein CDD80_411 [Ophiocordyceps camponoti-rufipedis]|uniref:Bromo domain-containing protein n=1 Tax=Ophiocordyceps camponoti-rufipedis TaxID=2004952 RepID=A0A2C5YKW1_9HYPO|nr:hypothetical protein CDD80_411 [Ophiocordyceps camponoti-rufipedis]
MTTGGEEGRGDDDGGGGGGGGQGRVGKSAEAAEVAAAAAAAPSSFSWLQPHPVFVVVLVGPDEEPFGIHKDFLCHRSDYYRQYFAGKSGDETVEHLVRLPEFSGEVFGLAQNFLYTGMLPTDEADVPSYESLVSLWKLGHKLGIRGLCDKTLDAMTDCRRLTERIPATPLLIQVWRDTPEGSSIRTLLLSWAAEYMRRSDSRAEFAKSLPQEVLSELVVAMSSVELSSATATPAGEPSSARKSVHYLESVSEEDTAQTAKKSRRTTEAGPDRKANRTPLPKPQKRRSSAAQLEGRTFTTTQKLEFCADLLSRMLSGPGFWTRLVGPFKDAVDPVEDGVPDYLDKIKRPMDLGSIKAKMDRREYSDEDEFLSDVRQIFSNCFTYWKKGDPMWTAGEKLQRTFEDKYSHMHRWIAKMGGEEGE